MKAYQNSRRGEAHPKRLRATISARIQRRNREGGRSAAMGESRVDQDNLFEKWERTRVRHSHKHPPVINVNQALELTPGQRIADSLALLMGVGRSSACNRRYSSSGSH
jgi:hypothetical protein